MLFDSTLRKELSRSFSGSLVVILTIVLTMMLIRTVGMAAWGEIAAQDVVMLLGYTALGQLPTILALSLFIAVVSTLTRQYRDSEMAVWFNSGISLARFVRPVLRFAAPVLLVIAAQMLVIWPWANHNISDLRLRYQQRSDLSRIAPGQFQASRDGRRVFFLDKQAGDSTTGHHIFILDQPEHHESITTAQEGRIEPQPDGSRRLVLSQGARTDLDLQGNTRTISRFERYSIRISEQAMAKLDDVPMKARQTVELLGLLHNPIAAGELAWRLGMIFASVNLLLWGLGLSNGGPRGGNNWVLLVALLSFVVYFNLMSLSQAWVSSGRYALLSTLVCLHGGMLAVGLLMLWWRVGGPTRSLWPRR